MQPDPVLAHYLDWMVNIGFFVTLAFVPINSLWWPWWKEWWGRNIVLLDLFIAGTLFPDVLYLDWHITAWILQWSQAVALTATVLVIPWRTALIWNAQRAEAVLERKRPPAPDGTGGDPQPGGEPA